MNKLFVALLALTLLGGVWAPTVDTALANKAGGAKTRLPNTLKGDTQPDDKQPVEKLA